jgi:hypothetical protein
MTPSELSNDTPAIEPWKGRRRLVSFRLTDDEYQGLKQLSRERGAMSLSEFVRSSVCAILVENREPWEQQLASSLREFGRQATELYGLVDQLSHLLRNACQDHQA